MTIWGRYKGGEPERIDQFPKREIAEMLREYKIAYGPDWELWAGLKQRQERESWDGTRKDRTTCQEYPDTTW